MPEPVNLRERAIETWRSSPITALVVGWLLRDVAEYMDDLVREQLGESTGGDV